MTTTISSEGHEEELVRPLEDDAKAIRRVLWFVAAIVVLLLVHGFVLEPVRVRSDSMSPTLHDGSVVLIDKVTFVRREPRRGDVIVTSDPRSGEAIVKRVVAVGGDSVAIDDGSLVINGSRVAESYIDNDHMEGYYFGPDVVPAGHLFLLGDNRSDSVDSRAFGPIGVDDVEGRVLAEIWPLG